MVNKSESQEDWSIMVTCYARSKNHHRRRVSSCFILKLGPAAIIPAPSASGMHTKMTNEIMWYHPSPISLMISGKRCDVSIFDPGRLISKVICDPGLTVCFTLWNPWNFGLRDAERCWENCSKTGSDGCPRLRNETMLSLAWKGQKWELLLLLKPDAQLSWICQMQYTLWP